MRVTRFFAHISQQNYFSLLPLLTDGLQEQPSAWLTDCSQAESPAKAAGSKSKLSVTQTLRVQLLTGISCYSAYFENL